jgi:hypothetical protein
MGPTGSITAGSSRATYLVPFRATLIGRWTFLRGWSTRPTSKWPARGWFFSTQKVSKHKHTYPPRRPTCCHPPSSGPLYSWPSSLWPSWQRIAQANRRHAPLTATAPRPRSARPALARRLHAQPPARGGRYARPMALAGRPRIRTRGKPIRTRTRIGGASTRAQVYHHPPMITQLW